LFGSTKVHIGLMIGLAAAAISHAMLSHMPLGFEIRAHGFNPVALRFRGTSVTRVVLMVMAISGAVAGIAGVGEVFGVTHRLRADSLYNVGYTGIIVGMIGGLTPLGTVLAALCFGGLASGALYMKVLVGVPSALVFAIEGTILIFFLCAGVASQYRLTKVVVHERTA
jgi:simple sugar transport system permease protein